MSNSFGRNEMNALIGGPATGAEEMAGFRRTGGVQNPRQSSRRITVEETDVSKMTAAETARMLTDKSKSKSSSIHSRVSRHRSKNKILAHHQLLAEELSKQQQQQQQRTNEAKKTPMQMKSIDDDTGDGDNSEFLSARTAVVVSQRSGVKERRSRRRRSDSSTSSSSSSSGSYSNDDKERGRRNLSNRRNSRERLRRSDSSSSSSDEEDDRRRNQRVIASRRLQEQSETIVTKLKDQVDLKTNINISEKLDSVDDKITSHKGKYDIPPQGNRMMSDPTKLTVRPRASHSSSDDEEETGSSSDSSSSTSDSSSSSSSNEEEEESVRLKPIFVPKHKRNLVQSGEQKLQEEELKIQLDNERKLKRRAESRALLAKGLAASDSRLESDGDEHEDEESGGAINPPPNDDDELNKEREKNRWEIRELDRLLKSFDIQETRKKEKEEYSRRKRLTDAECLKEDIESGRYQAPGAGRRKNVDSESRNASGLQRFFHRGAYYMDESEWDKGDIRQKAVEYAAAATGEDKIDKSKLPEIMQVKNFGRSRQNQRYKGLAKEDTSVKFARILPLRKDKGKSGS